MSRVIIITNIPASYRVDFYNLLSNNENIDFHFIFIPEKKDVHKKILWGAENNPFFSKSIFINKKRAISTIISLAKSIKKIKPDRIIIGGIPIYFVAVIVMKLLLRYEIYCWWGGIKNTEIKKTFKSIYRRLTSKYLDGYFFYSYYAFIYFNDEVRKVQRKFKIIGNNTRLSELELMRMDLMKSKIPYSNSCNKIITVGFQKSEKNTMLLLKALSILRENGFKIDVTIIGDGPELSNLVNFANSHNLSDIHFLGSIPFQDVFLFLLRSSLFVHCSYLDRWPQVYNEAAYCGLPILISNRAGVDNDYTQKYKDLVLFDPFSVDELADRIKHLLLNPNLCKELGSFANNDILENDGRKVMADFIEELK